MHPEAVETMFKYNRRFPCVTVFKVLIVLIELENLTKRFRQTVALDGVSGSIPAGRIGLLGPNGAGKSTLMKILLGLVTPTDGDGKVLGYGISTDSLEIRKRIGYMPEHECLPEVLSAVDFVSNFARYSGMSKQDALQRTHEVLHYLGMGDERYRPIKGYSGGMKQKVKLSQALVHDPEIVFLDEPTAALDPMARDDMLNTIREIADLGNTSFILSTHILHDVEQVCDNVVIINSGKILTISPLADILFTRETVVEVRITEETGAFASALRDEGMEAELNGSSIDIFVEDADAAFEAVVRIAAEKGFSLRHLARKRRDLDESYLELMHEHRRKEGAVP